jgi:uncharacterized membrane protein HdeD (DUF308 family)
LSAAKAATPVRFPWWLVLLEGIAAIVIGILLLTNTVDTLFTLILFLGVYWLVSGILQLVGLFIDQRMWPWRLVSGVLGVVAGLLIVRHPVWAVYVVPTTLVWVLAAFGVVIGLSDILRGVAGAGWAAFLFGVLSLLLGVLLFVRPDLGLVLVIWLASAFLIADGAMAIGLAFALRRIRPDAGRSVPGGATS